VNSTHIPNNDLRAQVSLWVRENQLPSDTIQSDTSFSENSRDEIVLRFNSEASAEWKKQRDCYVNVQIEDIKDDDNTILFTITGEEEYQEGKFARPSSPITARVKSKWTSAKWLSVRCFLDSVYYALQGTIFSLDPSDIEFTKKLFHQELTWGTNAHNLYANDDITVHRMLDVVVDELPKELHDRFRTRERESSWDYLILSRKKPLGSYSESYIGLERSFSTTKEPHEFDGIYILQNKKLNYLSGKPTLGAIRKLVECLIEGIDISLPNVNLGGLAVKNILSLDSLETKVLEKLVDMRMLPLNVNDTDFANYYAKKRRTNEGVVGKECLLPLLATIAEENKSEYSTIEAIDKRSSFTLRAVTKQDTHVILIEVEQLGKHNELLLKASVGKRKDEQLISVVETKIDASSTYHLRRTVQMLLDEFPAAINEAGQMGSEQHMLREDFIAKGLNIMDPMKYIDNKECVADYLNENIMASMTDPNIPYNVPFLPALHENLRENAKNPRNTSSWKVIMDSMRKGTYPAGLNDETIDFIHWVSSSKDAPPNEQVFWQSILLGTNESKLYSSLIRSGIYSVQTSRDDELYDSENIGANEIDGKTTLAARFLTAKIIEKFNLPNSALPLVDEGKLIRMIDEFTETYGTHKVGNGETRTITLSDVIQLQEKLERISIGLPSDDEYYPYP
jgi:hypothetical protein